MLEIKNLSKTYISKKGSECRAVNDISLDFGSKGLVFICGKSGSGKSTLLNLLSGLDKADSGEIIIDGKSSKKFSQSDFDIYRNTYVGFVFQDFNIMDDLSIHENVELALKLQNRKAKKGEIENILKLVGLEGYGDRRPFELSGGQKQRVCIARALVKNPKIIFADEPTGNLDAATCKQILNIFKHIAKTRLVIMVSHDEDSALSYSDRIIELEDGRVKYDRKKIRKVNVAKLKKEYEDKVNQSFETVEYKKAEYTGDSFNRIKTHMPFSYTAKTTFSNFRKKIFRFIVTTLLSVAALTIFGLADTLKNYDSYSATLNTVEELGISTFLGTNTVLLEPDEDEEDVKSSNNSFFSNPLEEDKYETIEFTPDKIQLIKDKGAVVFKKIPWQTALRSYLSMREEKIFSLSVSGLVEMSSVIDENTLAHFYGAKLVVGEYPKSDANEIQVMISDFMADGMMKYGAVLYDWLVLPNSGYQQIIGRRLPIAGSSVKIVGIYSTDYKDLDFTVKRKFQENFNKTVVYSSLLTNENALTDFLAGKALPITAYMKGASPDSAENGDDGVYTLGAMSASPVSFSQIKDMLGGVSVDLNALPFLKLHSSVDLNKGLAEGEIIVHLSYLLKFWGKDHTDENGQYLLGLDDLVDVDFEKEYEMHIFSENRQTPQKVKIVGVFDDVYYGDYRLSDNIMIVSDSLKQNIIKTSYPISNTFISLNGMGGSAKIDFLKYLDSIEVQYSTYASSELKFFDSLFLLLTRILNAASLIMCLFVMLLLYNFISSSIRSRQKDIGILRSLGARNWDIAKIYLLEAAVLCVFNIIITLVLMLIGSSALNAGLTEAFTVRLKVIAFNPLSFAYAAAACAVMVFAASIIPLIRIMLMKPIDVIKRA